MSWLKNSAKKVVSPQLCRQAVRWTTSLGLLVVQPYFRSPKTSARSDCVFHPPKCATQQSSFPANFIHSLDATHMMLTAHYCWRDGIAFAEVHDCFWTHACDVSQMNKICREQFVALHEGLAFRPSNEAGVVDVTLSKTAMPPLKLLADQFRRSYLQEQDEVFNANDVIATLPYWTCQPTRQKLGKFEQLNKHLEHMPTMGAFSIREVLRSIYFFS
jgi:DNA-directed RNA polymerase